MRIIADIAALVATCILMAALIGWAAILPALVGAG